MFKKTTSSTPPNIAILSSSTLIEKSPPHFLYHQQHNGQHSGCHQEIWDQVLALLLVCCATPGKSVNLSEFHPSQREESTPTWDYCGVKCGAIGESSWYVINHHVSIMGYYYNLIVIMYLTVVAEFQVPIRVT